MVPISEEQERLEMEANKEKIKEDIAKRLREIRKRKNITQSKVADAVITTQSDISDWEKEASPRSPSPEELYLLSKFYGVSVDYLLGLSKTESPDATIQGAVKLTGLSEKAVVDLQDPINKRGESRIHPFINALLESPYLHRIAYEFNQLLLYRDLYINSEKRHADLVKTAKSSSAVYEEDLEVIAEPSYMKNADFDNLKFAQFKLLELLTRFAVNISESEGENVKEES